MSREIKYQLIWQGAIYEPISLQELVLGQWEIEGVMYKDFGDNEKGWNVSIQRKDYVYFSEDENDFGIWRKYTGLNDKNGKEIYEGDLIQQDNHIFDISNEYKNNKGLIKKAIKEEELGNEEKYVNINIDENFKYILGNTGIRVFCDKIICIDSLFGNFQDDYNNYFGYTCISTIRESKIVGNIYENPELLI